MDETSDLIGALRAKFPNIRGPRKKDTCYATQNRQNAVKNLVDKCDSLLVVGSPNGSNSSRPRAIAEKMGMEAHLASAIREDQTL